MHISCVEIYNEVAYDLLNATRDAVHSLEDLQRVTLLEDGDAVVHARNLSLHRAATEQEALNLVRRHLRTLSMAYCAPRQRWRQRSAVVPLERRLQHRMMLPHKLSRFMSRFLPDRMHCCNCLSAALFG